MGGTGSVCEFARVAVAVIAGSKGERRNGNDDGEGSGGQILFTHITIVTSVTGIGEYGRVLSERSLPNRYAAVMPLTLPFWSYDSMTDVLVYGLALAKMRCAG